MRLTEKIKETYWTNQDNCALDYVEQDKIVCGGKVLTKLGQLEDLMDKYGLENVEDIELLCKYSNSVKEWMDIYKDKMYQIKNIENELGIDLTILFEALKNGIYFRNPTNNKINSSLLICGELEISEKGLTMLSMEMDILFYFKDYGKTWALTKEELEK